MWLWLLYKCLYWKHFFLTALLTFDFQNVDFCQETAGNRSSSAQGVLLNCECHPAHGSQGACSTCGALCPCSQPAMHHQRCAWCRHPALSSWWCALAWKFSAQPAQGLLWSGCKVSCSRISGIFFEARGDLQIHLWSIWSRSACSQLEDWVGSQRRGRHEVQVQACQLRVQQPLWGWWGRVSLCPLLCVWGNRHRVVHQARWRQSSQDHSQVIMEHIELTLILASSFCPMNLLNVQISKLECTSFLGWVTPEVGRAAIDNRKEPEDLPLAPWY